MSDLYLRHVPNQPDGYGLLATFSLPSSAGSIALARTLLATPAVTTGALDQLLRGHQDANGVPQDLESGVTYAYSVGEITEKPGTGVVAEIRVWYKKKA